MDQNQSVSIIVPMYNSARTIKKTIDSILAMEYQDFELLLVDANSSDDTVNLIRQFSDPRIHLIECDKRKTAGEGRNIGIKYAQNEYLFFTDSDCIVSLHWISNGLPELQRNGVLGVEGRVIYVNENYRRTFSDRVVENLNGKEYMTANMAYRKQAILDVGGFSTLPRKQDRVLGLRVEEKGKIIFCPKMEVYHQQNIWGYHNFLTYPAKEANSDVFLYAEHRFHPLIHYRIYEPLYLLALFFPPIILGILLQYRIRTKRDTLLFLLIYPSLILLRASTWKAALENRVFVV